VLVFFLRCLLDLAIIDSILFVFHHPNKLCCDVTNSIAIQKNVLQGQSHPHQIPHQAHPHQKSGFCSKSN